MSHQIIRSAYRVERRGRRWAVVRHSHWLDADIVIQKFWSRKRAEAWVEREGGEVVFYV